MEVAVNCSRARRPGGLHLPELAVDQQIGSALMVDIALLDERDVETDASERAGSLILMRPHVRVSGNRYVADHLLHSAEDYSKHPPDGPPPPCRSQVAIYEACSRARP